MNLRWIEPQIILTSDEIKEKFQRSILIAELLAKRGITSQDQADQFLFQEKYQQTSPYAFSEMEKTLARISRAINKGEMIGIWGDFDVDGQTSTALLVDGFIKIGAQVIYHIPVRETESHGIKKEYLKSFMKEGVQLLITCDTGISEMKALQYAKQQGLDVIISDHHTLPATTPPAYSIINPNFLEESHPFRNLAGVGTAFQIIRGLYELFLISGREESYYDLVALGTIADLVKLTMENRFYAQKGLQQMNHTLRPSLQAILETAGIEAKKLNESHISFTFAPRLNASGRLDNANGNVEFLIARQKESSLQYAEKLENFNDQRKLAVDGVFISAEQMLEKEPGVSEYPIILLAKNDWEPGVVGIAASRLVEKYNKPAILLKIDGEVSGGSARSTSYVSIIDIIQENSQYLLNFGGHPMAAGISLPTENIDDFRKAISRSASQRILGKNIEKELQIDAVLSLSSINPGLLSETDNLAPYGSGNPPPVLVTNQVEIINQTSLGKTKRHQKLLIQDSQGETREAIWWNSCDLLLPRGRFDLAYTIKPDLYNNSTSIILEWIDFRESEAELIEIIPATRRMQIHDHRVADNQNIILNNLIKQSRVLLWNEGIRKMDEYSSVNRLGLRKQDSFAILSPPPDYEILNTSLDIVLPKEVYLFSINRPEDRIEKFLNNLAGLIKHCIGKKGGAVNPGEFAALTGHRDNAIWLGLRWWEAKGSIAITIRNGSMLIRGSDNLTSKALQDITNELQKVLRETAAFRSYYLRADPRMLLKN